MSVEGVRSFVGHRRGHYAGPDRDELFAREIFDSVRQARFLYQEWRHVYSHQRPHSSLGCLAPAAFVLRCRTIVAEPS